MSKAATLVLPLVLGVLAAPCLEAQVGHDPARSPFRDVTTRQGIGLVVGRFAGNRTVTGVGARPGALLGIRFDTRLSGPLDMWVTVGHAASSRMALDPTVAESLRISGPVDLNLLALDAALALNLTGPKTWRRLAPYVSLGLGVVAATATVVDPGGYRAGTNFSIVPTIGTRIHVARNMALRVEMRDHFFRYEWPLAYRNKLDASGNAVSPVLADGSKDTQWTHNAALLLGLSYIFTF